MQPQSNHCLRRLNRCVRKHEKLISLSTMLIMLAIFSISLLTYCHLEKHSRAEIKPQLQARPVHLNFIGTSKENDMMAEIKIEFLNHSGFDASDAKVDVLVLQDWINKYIEDRIDFLKREKANSRLSAADEQQLMKDEESLRPWCLKPGDRGEQIKIMGWGKVYEDPFHRGKNRIFIRKLWKNKDGYQFDEIECYRVDIRKISEFGGETYDFIPEKAAILIDEYRKSVLKPN